MELMEQYIKLAPSIAMVNVTKIDTQQHYSCQIIPSTASSTKILKPYQVRRKYEDFELLSKSISAVLASQRYTVLSGTISLNGTTLAYLPQFPEKSSTNSTVHGLDSYIKHLLLLPKQILKLLPLDKFFGHWIQDKFETKAVLSESLATKIGAMISLGYDTSDEVLANILKRDQDLKDSSSQVEALVSGIPDIQPDVRSTRIESFQRPLSQLSQSPSGVSGYADDNVENSLSSSRASEIPTYEEFVAKLANSLSVDINEAATSDDVRDTIADNPFASGGTNMTTSKRNSSLGRMSIQSVDTVLASPVPVRSIIFDRSSMQLQNQELRKNSDDRLSLPPRSSSCLSGVKNVAEFENDDYDEANDEKENMSVALNYIQKSDQLTMESKLSKDTIIEAGDIPPPVPKKDSPPPVIHVRNGVSKNDLRLRTELARSDLARKSPRTNSGGSETIFNAQKSGAKPHLFQQSSPASLSSNSATSPVTIPSRKESKNWNINSPEGPRSSSPLARRGANKDYVSSPKILKMPLEINRDDTIGTLLRATARRSPEIQSLHSIDSASSYASRQPTPLSLVNHFTIKLIQTSGDPIAIKVADVINYDGLLAKISLVIGQMNKMRVCYRDLDYELITITDDESWDMCKETINEEDKLTLFLVKKVVLNAIKI